MPTRRQEHPGAASEAIRHLFPLDPAGRPAQLLGVFPHALYLRLAAASGPAVIALVTSDGIRPPNAVTIAARAAASPWNTPGNAALVGPDWIAAPGVRVQITRWWSPRRSAPPPEPAAAWQRRVELVRALRTATAGPGIGPLPEPLAGELALLTAAGRLLDAAQALRAAGGLLGRGQGLTPSGDDLVAGFLVTLRTHGTDPGLHAFTEQLAAWVDQRAPASTTALSAALLGHAGRGQALDEVVDLLDAVAGRAGPVGPRLERLLAVGHQSGRDLAHGVAAGLGVTLARPWPNPEECHRDVSELRSPGRERP